MSGIARESALVPLTPTADHSDKQGYLVKDSAGDAALNDSATVPALGVIVDGEDTDGKDTVGIFGSGLPPVYMRAGGAIAKHALVQQTADGKVVTDAGAGARCVVGRALEAAGGDGALFAVQPWTPTILA